MLIPPANLAEAEQLLKDRAEHRIKLGLGPTRAAARRLGNPQLSYPTVHIAGTNGKGSTLAFLDGLCRGAGLRTGRTTSPHLRSPRERMLVDGRPAAGDDFVRALAAVFRASGAEPPSYFELLTLASFWHFRQKQVDLGLVEVGLGGRLDATRILQPMLTIIAPVGLDHAKILGDTPAAIAAEKAAIMKPGVPVVLAPQPFDEAEKVVLARASALGCPVFRAGAGDLPGDCVPGLPGAHQRDNAGVALAAYRLLEGMEFPQCKDPSAALAGCHWPGRLHRVEVENGPTLWLDGAHNEDGCRALARFMAGRPGPKEALFTALGDKPLAAMIAPLLDHVDHWTACALPGQPRSGTRETLLPCLPADSAWADSPREAWDLLLKSLPDKEQPEIYVFGSLYLVGALYELLGKDPFRP